MLGTAAKGAAKAIAGRFFPGDDPRQSEAEAAIANTIRVELAQIEAAIRTKELELEAELAKAQRDVIIADAKGESTLQRNWRPGLMILFGTLFATVAIIVVLDPAPEVDPERMAIIGDLFKLLMFGFGGFIGGRTAEKMTATIVSGKTERMKNNGGGQ